MPKVTRSTGLAAAVLSLLVWLAPAQTALARPSILGDGADLGLVVGTDMNVFGIRHFPDSEFTFFLGFYSIDPDVTNLFQPTFLPSFGAGITLGNLVVGLHLEGGFFHVNPDGAFATDVNVGLINLIAFVEYFLDGDDFAPVIGGQFGPSITVPDGIDASVYLVAGVFGGLHFFTSDSFSVGPIAGFNFLYRSSDERAGWEITLGVTMRGWVGLGGGGAGGGGGDTSEPEAEPEPYNPPPANDPEPEPEYETDDPLTNPEEGAL